MGLFGLPSPSLAGILLYTRNFLWVLVGFFGLPLRCPLCCSPPALAGIQKFTRNFLWVLVGFFGLSSRCLCALHCSRAPLSLSSPALAGIQKYTRNFCRFLWVGIGSCRFLWAFFTLSSGFLRATLALPALLLPLLSSRCPLCCCPPALAGIQKYTRNFCRFLCVGIGSCGSLWVLVGILLYTRKSEAENSPLSQQIKFVVRVVQ